MAWQKQKKRQGDNGSSSNNDKEFKRLDRPSVDSAIEEAESALEGIKQAQEQTRPAGRCGCW